MTSRAQLAFRLSGVTMVVPLSWLAAVLIVLGITLFALQPAEATAARRVGWAASGTLLALALAGSLLLHEVGQALVARRVGWPEDRIRLYPFGGVDETYTAPGTPRQEALTAIAGPAVNLAIAATVGGVSLVVQQAYPGVGRWLLYLALGNSLIGAVHLLPGYPLDGGRLFRALVWYLHDSFTAGTRAAVTYGQFISVTALLGGALALSLRADWSIWGLWIVVVSWAMARAARQELARSYLVSVGDRVQAFDVVIGLNPHVNIDLPLDEVIETLLAHIEVGIALVTQERHVRGIVRLEDLHRFPRADWRRLTARDAMIPAGELPRVPGSLSVRELLHQIDLSAAPAILVIENGGAIGAVDRRLAVSHVARLARGRMFRSGL